MLAALATILLGLAVLGMISPTLFGLLRGTGIRLGLWENAILLVGGVITAFFASRAER